ncbi:MAG: glycine cleavage system protein H [Bacteroides sp. SM23_62_1]|nr:MAG: glycine cleavage system protein H [Bacteroides sp. SM23_62_1]
MNVPEDLMYTDKHEWIRKDGDEAVIGITDYAQGELGDIVFVEIETEGEELEAGDTFGTIEAVKTVSDLFMPVSGLIREVNPDLTNKPELVNKDPYGEGWMIRIKMQNHQEIEELLTAEKYVALISG